MFNNRYVVGLAVLFFIPFLFLCHESHGAKIEASVGFAGNVLEGKMNPLYICLSGPDNLGPAPLAVSHELGSPWRGKANKEWNFSSSTWGAGCYVRQVPIYDITNPLEISLEFANGESLREEVELKDSWSQNPFSLGVDQLAPGTLLPENRISPDELPDKWQAYGSLSSLWLGGSLEGLSRDSEEEIIKWVFQGGTLVLFTGSNYPRFQSSPLGGTLPLSEPRLTRGEEGYMLLGNFHPDAEVLVSEKGNPLLVEKSFGAGNLYTVTRDSRTVSEDLLDKIASNVKESQAPSMVPLLEELFEDVKVNAPGKNMALVLVASLLFSLLVFGQKPDDNSKKAISIVVISLSLAIVFAVVLGQDAARRSVYSTEIKLSTNVGGGFAVSWNKLYSLVDTELELAAFPSSVPVFDLPREYTGDSIDSRWVEGQGTKAALGKNTSRVFSYSKNWDESISFNEGQGRIEITNNTGQEISKTVLLKEGRVYDLGLLTAGSHDFPLENQGTVRDVEELSDPYGKSLSKIIQDYSLGDGTWLISFQWVNGDRSWGNERVNHRGINLFLLTPEGSGVVKS